MKRFLIPLLAALALPAAINAGVDTKVHNLCKDVKDYMGCVKANRDSQANVKSVPIEKSRKQRPLWMKEKIKGCFRYKDELKKNNCIKTYSPYGNPIPDNLEYSTQKDTSSILDIAIKKINEEDYEGAIYDCTQGIILDPSNSKFFACRGVAKGFQGKKRDALKDLNRAIEIEPNPFQMETYYWRAVFKFSMRRKERSALDRTACSDLRKAHKAGFQFAIDYAEQNKSFLQRDKCYGIR